MAVPPLGPSLAGVKVDLLGRPLWNPTHCFATLRILASVSRRVSCRRMMSGFVFFRCEKVLAGCVIPLTFQDTILVIVGIEESCD